MAQTRGTGWAGALAGDPLATREICKLQRYGTTFPTSPHLAHFAPRLPSLRGEIGLKGLHTPFIKARVCRLLGSPYESATFADRIDGWSFGLAHALGKVAFLTAPECA
jgi:hypothetical protein